MSNLIEYDRFGRMKYHPDFHANNGLPWSAEDTDYLISNYCKIGPEECSLALERTIDSVMRKMHKLRKHGVIGSQKRTYTRRSRCDD